MTAPTRQQRQEAAKDALAAELERTIATGEFAAWFERLARFRQYSPGNQQLIAAQRPGATHVASFASWKRLDRSVNKGERGILINVPKPYWLDLSGQRIPPPTTPSERAAAVRKVTFGVGYVFDISQTEGADIDLGPTGPAHAPDTLADQLHGYCRDHGVTVKYRSGMPNGLAGYYRRSTDTVALNANDSHGEQIATLAHELAHREDPELQAAHTRRDTSYYTHNRPDCEAAAEAASHMIAALHHFDITAAAAGYIATWVQHDTDRLTVLHERVCSIVDTICPPQPTAAGAAVVAEPVALYDAARTLGPLPAHIPSGTNPHGLYQHPSTVTSGVTAARLGV